MSQIEVGAKCLAFHGPLLYEAKILKSYDPKTKQVWVRPATGQGAAGGELEVSKSDPDLAKMPPALTTAARECYFIHYKGWKKSWDEWVHPERVLPHTEESVRMSRELKEAAQRDKKQTAAAAASATHSAHSSHRRASDAARSRRRTPVPGAESPEPETARKRRKVDAASASDHSRHEIALSTPLVLKEVLVNDWENVTKEHQIVALPRNPSVSQILQDYLDAELERDPQLRDPASAEGETLREVLAGVKLYFDRALGSMLLYRYERQQYFEQRQAAKGEFVPSDVYGAEHLLRLFVSFPGLIAQTSMELQAVQTLRRHLERLLKFVADNREKYCTQPYENTSRRYESLAVGV